MENEHPIKAAADIVGNQRVLAEKLGVQASFISQVASGHRKLPPIYCRKIEALTKNKVTAEQLRPDIFGPPSEAA